MARNNVVERMLAISAAFLMVGVAPAIASECIKQHANPHVAQAEQLLQQNKSRQAYAYLNVAREQGSGEAHQFAASMFERGRGVLPDATMVNHLNWMGAQYENSEAMFRTAAEFYGRGLRKDGEFWAKKAYDCGHSGALILLMERSISEKRDAEARHYLEKGIDAGLVVAKLTLAEQYDKGGLGLPKDPQRAFYWYSEAAAQGDAKAMAAIAYYFFRGVHGVQDETAAIHWYHEAAKAGHVESMTAYAWMLANGKGGQVNFDEAMYYFKKAALANDNQAKKFLIDYSGRNITSRGMKG